MYKVLQTNNSILGGLRWHQAKAMAFAPPANNAGLPIPEISANPPSLSDITNIKDYVERLIQSKGKCLFPADAAVLNATCWIDLDSISGSRCENHATDDDIGAAELYLHESVLRTSLGGAAAPPWLDAFVNTLDQMRQSIERIEQSQKYTSAVIDNIMIAKANVELRSTGSTPYLAKQKVVCSSCV